MRERISSAVFLTSSPGAIRFISRRIIPRFCMSARTAAATPGYWTLTATSRPSCSARAVDLADRGGGDRLVVELGEVLLQRPAELGLDHLAHVGEAHLRRGVAQRAELALELLAVLLGHEPDVEEAHDLPELHRRALHRPQRGDDLLGRLEVPALQRGVACPRRERARFVARVPSWRAAWPAARLETFAVREIREVGILSLAIVGRRDRVWPCGGGAVVGVARVAWAPAVAVAVGVAVAVAVGRRVGRRRRRRGRRRRAVAVAVAVAVGVGVAVAWTSGRRTALVRAVGVADRVAEDGELGRGDHGGADHGREQAGDDRRAASGKRRRGRSGARRPNGSSSRPPQRLTRSGPSPRAPTPVGCSAAHARRRWRCAA